MCAVFFVKMCVAIGSSTKLYARCASLIRRRFAETGEVSLCAMQSDLLLSLTNFVAQLHNEVRGEGAEKLKPFANMIEHEPCRLLVKHLEALCGKVAANFPEGTRAVTVEARGDAGRVAESVANEVIKIRGFDGRGNPPPSAPSSSSSSSAFSSRGGGGARSHRRSVADGNNSSSSSSSRSHSANRSLRSRLRDELDSYIRNPSATVPPISELLKKVVDQVGLFSFCLLQT